MQADVFLRILAAMQVNVWVAVISGIVAIVVAIIGYTRFVAEKPLEAEKAQLQGELKRKEEDITRLKEQNERELTEARRAKEQELETRERELAQLQDEYHVLHQDFMNLKSGRSAAIIRREIDNEMARSRRSVGATENSVFVPGPLPSSRTFVFLSIYGRAAPKLRKTKLPIDKGIVGLVYKTGQLQNTWEPYQEKDFLQAVDRVGGHLTRSMLTVPVKHDGKVIGVVQFLNKADDKKFDRDDETVAVSVAEGLAPKIAEFVSDQSNFEILGLSTEKGQEAVVLFCDLTASSTLMDSLNPSSVIDMINEYLERQASIAFKYGATLDKYLGDGAMFVFDARRVARDGDHATTAVKAAIHMQNDFRVLRRGWLELGMRVENVHNRLGIACGTVLMPVMGHPQFQQVTVFGDTVGRAAHLCEVAPRDRSVILIDQELARRVRDDAKLDQLLDDTTKEGDGGQSTFEVSLDAMLITELKG
jgi:class 3 adenylate cyclase/Skp family chaperone for outer membrane proteins